MKISYLYTFLLATLVLIACDPLKEVDEKINDNSTFVQDIDYTLTEDDYELVDERYGSFSDIEDVKTQVPVILAANFPALGKSSSALVFYEFYNGSSPDLRGTKHVDTVSEADYEALGYKYGSFDNATSDVVGWANYKYPDAEDGDYADVTFDYYTGGIGVRTDTALVVYTVAYQWQYGYILPDEAYGDFFQESGTDFSNKDEGADKMPTYLNWLYANGSDYSTLNLKEGTSTVVQYNYDDRYTDEDNPGNPNEPAVALYIFNGAEWLSYGDAYQTTTESLNFGFDGNVWVPDNTIKYPMAQADYDFVIETYADITPAGVASMAQYGNYDLTIWSSENIQNSIADVLAKNFGGAEEGQKYSVSYKVYTGSAGDTYNILMIKQGDIYVPLVE
jgi:hypothetical protein